jgi:uncharacterized protein
MKHEQSDLTIRISQLSEGIHNYQLISHPSELELAENFQASITVDASLEKTKRQLYLRASVSTKAQFQCDRCSNDFELPIQTSYSICYAYDETDSTELPDDELRVVHLGTPYLHLADDVRDCIMLAVPMKLVCKDECKGLCPHCGVDMNYESCSCAEETTDSRFEVLRTLISNNKN